MMLRTTVKHAAALAIGLTCAAPVGASEPVGTAAGNPDAAGGKVSMCIGCHGIAGYKASFPEVYQVPKIAGQNARYIEAALNEYKKGSRSHPTMDAIAASLSDQDIADLAAYYSQYSQQK